MLGQKNEKKVIECHDFIDQKMSWIDDSQLFSTDSHNLGKKKIILGVLAVFFMLAFIGVIESFVGHHSINLSTQELKEQNTWLPRSRVLIEDKTVEEEKITITSKHNKAPIVATKTSQNGLKNDGSFGLNRKSQFTFLSESVHSAPLEREIESDPSLRQMEKSHKDLKNKEVNVESENQKKISLYESKFEHYRMKLDFEIPEFKERREELEKYGFDKNIQLASKFDYMNITQSPIFDKVRSEWEDYFPYELFSIEPNPQFERDPGYLELSDNFPTLDSLSEYILKEGNNLNPRVLTTEIFGLAVLLSTYPEEPLVKEAEYRFFDNKYKIGSYSEELPICVFSIGYNVKSKNKHQEFFESLERMNYTNYKLVIVDDDSIDGSAEFFYHLLDESTLKLRNRARVVRNLKRVGSTGNLIMRSKKFCSHEDIVVNIDTDDKFIGSQVFKIINAIYQNEEIWSAYSRFIFRDLMKNTETLFRSTVIPENYRAAVDNWSTTHLKTYRRKLIEKIPLEYFLEYHYNEELDMIEPHFFKSASDRYMVYSIIELSGLDRVFLIDAVFYYYYYFPDTDPNCYRSHQRVDEFKARIKTPLQRLESLDSKPEPVKRYQVPGDLLYEMSKFYETYRQCLFVKKTRDLTIYQFKEGLKNALEKNLNCKNFTLILSDSERLHVTIPSIHAKTIRSELENITEEQRKEMIKKSLHSCAIVIDLEFESYLLHYPKFEYIIIPTEEFDILNSHINRHIAQNKMNSKISTLKIEVPPKVYLAVKFYKKMENLVTGAWAGNDPQSVAMYYTEYKEEFGNELVAFYEKEKCKKVLDIGCGRCLYAQKFKDKKIVLTAYDGNPYTEELSNKTAQVRDFSERVFLGTKFEWVQSFHVGEHIPKPMFNRFIANLAHHSTKGILLAWRTPESQPSPQPLGLQNPLPNSHIVRALKDKGFVIDIEKTNEMRKMESFQQFQDSLMVFRKK